MKASAETPAYVNWKQYDARWGKILIGDTPDTTLANIGCAATSTAVLLAHSGVCSSDESVFNPAIYIPQLKEAGAFISTGGITWRKVSELYPDFEFIDRAELRGTKEEKLEQIKDYYAQGYYMVVSVDTTGGTTTDHWVSVRTIDYDTNTVYIMDTGGKNYTDLSKYSITGNIVLFKAPRPIGWRDNIPPYDYEEITTGTYYLKNSSTNTYIRLSDDNSLSLGTKEETDAFKMKISGDFSSGYNILPVGNEYKALTFYSDDNGTYINLSEPNSDTAQKWKFRNIGNEYIIYNVYDENQVLTADGTYVTVNTAESSENQIWELERDYNLMSISVSKEPETLIYENGSKYFSTSGMVVTARYSDGTTRDVTGYTMCYDFSTVGKTDVLISYTENGITQTATQAVTIQDIFKGKGTKRDPYQINNPEDFHAFITQINNISSSYNYNKAYYIQNADINAESVAEPIGSGYESILSDKNSDITVFNGNYNGNYHKLTNYNLNYSKNYAGVFGKTGSNCIISNLSVTGEIDGQNYVGGIVGEASYGTKIQNCSFKGSISGDNCIGGIVGRYYGGSTVSGCYANADITATAVDSYAGGVAGQILVGNDNKSVNANTSNCYFAGTINSTYTGGICGEVITGTISERSVTFENCYYLEGASSGAVNSMLQTGCNDLDIETLKIAGAELLGTPFITTDEFPVFEWEKDICGDVNSDKELSTEDILMLQHYLTKKGELSNSNKADVNNDGIINVFDLILIKRLLIFV